MTHLESDYIADIALHRVIEAIVSQCIPPDDGSKPALTLWEAADLIITVWRYMDRKVHG